MEVPNKVKVFAWRFGQDSLPTRRNLAKKRIIENPECPFCKSQCEDLFQAIFEYPDVARMWLHYPLHSINQTTSRNSLDILLSCLLKCLDRFENLISTIWGICQRRNQFVFEQKVIPLNGGSKQGPHTLCRL